MKQHDYDLIIIGAGIAGMTAAIYALRAGKTALVLEAKITGGQIVQAASVHNWPGEKQISGEQLAQNVYHQAESLGATFEFDEVTEVTLQTAQDSVSRQKSTTDARSKPQPTFQVRTLDSTYRSHALILATGSRDKPLGLANEDKYIGHGLSYCATCDGALFRNRDIAVIGGGNTAFHDALYLANLARKVYLVHRRPQFRADVTLVQKVKQLPNVELVTGMIPQAFNGSPNLTQLVLVPNPDLANSAQPASASDSNSAQPAFGSGSTSTSTVTDPDLASTQSASDFNSASAQLRTLDVAGVFVAIGREPATVLFENLVTLDESGYIIAGEDCRTAQAGVFVAGDCRTKSVRQLVTAAADGAVAATNAVEYLNNLDNTDNYLAN